MRSSRRGLSGGVTIVTVGRRPGILPGAAPGTTTSGAALGLAGGAASYKGRGGPAVVWVGTDTVDGAGGGGGGAVG
ncbi:hypothetical protein BOTBODRAFT_361641 [Botryobasidium botryosum FD-172 SS1]|uniref:Uncharacterized protein n=1 Tax=Botryobasidium botryosum (strain FD-172 SS1) TaxID=930990 RepID=A0A067MDM2_BOTB1|nr:hypothetical protein BOTBODRAFT_361641 [Botryobasidium botryosum FD-172 SS1]